MKARRFDLYPDDFIAGVAGELTPAEMGVYSMVILLCYSHGGSIPDDADWLRSKFIRSGASRGVGPAIEQLVKLGKLVRADGELTSSRVRAECERALSRLRASIEGGARGGRHPKKTNGVAQGDGSSTRATTINHQPSTKQQDARDARSGFDEFWLTYPHRVGKGAAEAKYRIARKAATQAELLDGVRRYIATKPADHNWCNPATWLNQRRWEDQPDDLFRPLNGHDAAPMPPLDPKVLGHSLPCACSNCTRWAQLHQAREEGHDAGTA